MKTLNVLCFIFCGVLTNSYAQEEKKQRPQEPFTCGID